MAATAPVVDGLVALGVVMADFAVSLREEGTMEIRSGSDALVSVYCQLRLAPSTVLPA